MLSTLMAIYGCGERVHHVHILDFINRRLRFRFIHITEPDLRRHIRRWCGAGDRIFPWSQGWVLGGPAVSVKNAAASLLISMEAYLHGAHAIRAQKRIIELGTEGGGKGRGETQSVPANWHR